MLVHTCDSSIQRQECLEDFCLGDADKSITSQTCAYIVRTYKEEKEALGICLYG